MNILLDTIEKLPEMAALRQAVLKENLPCSLARVANGAKQHLARSLSEKRNVFFICATDYEARQRYAQYIYANKILLPAPQIELHPVETRGEETSFERIAALSKLGGEGSVVFLSMDSLLFKMRPAAQFYGRFLTLEQGAIFPPAKLAEALVAMGYEGGPMVESPGQIAGRGEILEVFPPGGKSPWRITFFDDEIREHPPLRCRFPEVVWRGRGKNCAPAGSGILPGGTGEKGPERLSRRSWRKRGGRLSGALSVRALAKGHFCQYRSICRRAARGGKRAGICKKSAAAF